MRYARKLMFQIIINVPDSKPALINENNHPVINENNHPADLSNPDFSADLSDIDLSADLSDIDLSADLSDPGLSAYFLLILFRLEVIAR